VIGILTRKAMEAALAQNQPPKLAPAVTCLRGHTIRELQQLLIDSMTQFVVVLDREDGQVVGLITLHDLLRAESSMAQQAQEEV